MVAHGVLADLQHHRQPGLLGRRDQRLGVLELDHVEGTDAVPGDRGGLENLVEAGQRHRLCTASQARQAAPRQPARSPSAARSIRGGRWKVSRFATSARSGSRRASPLSARPPPTRTRSTPGDRHGRDDRLGQGGGGPGPHGGRVGVAGGGPDGDLLGRDRAAPVRAAYSRSTAAAEAITSRHPVAPHPQAGPAGSTTTCPSSPAQPSAGPLRPSSSSAPAIPVPTGRNSACRAPRAAPSRVSANSPARTSWPTTAGTPSNDATGSRTGRSRQPRFTENTPTPPALVHQAGHDDPAADQPSRAVVGCAAVAEQVGHRRVDHPGDVAAMSVGVGVVTAASVS